MKKQLAMTMCAAVLAFFVSNANGEAGKDLGHEQYKTLLGLFQDKCTKCHDAARAQKMHQSGKDPQSVVKAMQKKTGADITDADASSIAELLELPSWSVVQSKCTQCHSLDRIVTACQKGPVTPETLKRMQKKGADITDQQATEIQELINKKKRHEKRLTLAELFSSRCTQCHDAARAQKLHQSTKKPTDVVNVMKHKPGSDISGEEAINIAKFLEAPFWLQPLFNSDCTQCHSVDRIVETCKKGPITKETIKEMQKKGAKITDEQVDDIYEMLNQ